VVLRLYQEMIDKEKNVFSGKLFYYQLKLSHTNGTLIPAIEPDIDILGCRCRLSLQAVVAGCCRRLLS
jgi:hypothetical protein